MIESYMKASKAITLLLCLAVICAGNFEAVSQTSSSNHSNHFGRTWSKQELLNAGFKFSPEKRPHRVTLFLVIKIPLVN